MSARFTRFPLPPGMPGIDTHLYIPAETPEEAPPVNAHSLRPLRHHAKERLGRLADRLRRHDDDPGGPDMDLQDPGDSATITEAIQALPPEPEPWWGMTEMDIPPAHDRRYVPDPLGLYPRAVPQPDPGPQADLGRSLIWRAAVRDHFVRQERAHGRITAGPPWFVEYARIYRKRTGLVSVREPDFTLHRWDHVVDEIVAQAREAVDAEWMAAQAARAVPVRCQEYAGRHSGRNGDAA